VRGLERRQLLRAGGIGLGAATLAATGSGFDASAQISHEAPDLTRLDLDSIQGNILAGFNKDHQHFLFFQLPDSDSGREWLRTTVETLASSREVLAFNNLFRRAGAQRRAALPKATWANLALTFSGLRALGVPERDLDAFPSAFRMGMKARAELIGDVGDSAPETWVESFGSPDVHGVLILAADLSRDLAAEVAARKDDLAGVGGTVLFEQAGRTRVDEPGHEHFGFKDGVSQPGIRGVTRPNNPDDPDQGQPGQDLLWPGEFVLGYPTQIPTPTPGESTNNDPGPISTSGPAWTVNGSYLVLRRLRQDVQGFRSFVARAAAQIGMDEDVLGAKIVGRYRNGCPLERTEGLPEDVDPTAGDPSRSDRSLLDDDRINNFEFGDDPDGLVVPRAAHIRKAYPRDEDAPTGPEATTQTHRLLRRGIPFGVSLDESARAGSPAGADATFPDDRGLLFLCYQSSIRRQFEFVQRRWVNDGDFPADGDGQDPVITQSSAAGRFRIPSPRRTHVLMMRHFVTTTGGEYFFQPSLDALRRLSGG
jgi:Dyp-type peroxidase family